MLKKDSKVKVHVYNYESDVYKGFYVEIIERDPKWSKKDEGKKYYDIWLCHDTLCHRMSMWGSETDDLEDLIETIDVNLEYENYIPSFINEVHEAELSMD